MNPTIKTILISLLTVFASALLAGVVALYGRVRKLEDSAAKTETKIEPFWAVVQAKMAKDLTHPSAEFHIADDLLAKLVDETLTPAERTQLLELMEARMVDPNPKVGAAERETAGGMAFVMRKAEAEAANSRPPDDVKMVAIQQEKSLEPESAEHDPEPK
jgi:hypothetical protein